ncbi:MAG TPA: hypothetical protein VMU05_14725, partial [Dongiaceae bacterium]|nr:hypothetical protein [Dongiaceae bacterium]
MSLILTAWLLCQAIKPGLAEVPKMGSKMKSHAAEAAGDPGPQLKALRSKVRSPRNPPPITYCAGFTELTVIVLSFSVP